MTPQEKVQQEEVITSAHHDYEKGMGSYAFFKTNDHCMAQDLVQDTFMKTWRYLVKGGKIILMKPFLYHVLNQLIIDQYRKHKTTSLDLLREKGFEPSFDHSENIFNKLDGKSASLLIKDLPIKYEMIIRMRFIQELSIREISLITGQTQNSVAVRTRRGLIKLRKLYSHS